MSEQRRRRTSGQELFASLSERELEQELSAWDNEFDALVEASDDDSTLKVDVEAMTLAQIERMSLAEVESLFGEVTSIDREPEALAIDEDDIVDEGEGAEARAVVEVAPAPATALEPDRDPDQDVVSTFAALGPPEPLAIADGEDDFYAELEIETEAFALSGEWSAHVPTKEGQPATLADVLRQAPRATAPSPMPVATSASDGAAPASATEPLVIARQHTTKPPPLASSQPALGPIPIGPATRTRVRDAVPQLILDDVASVAVAATARGYDADEEAARLLLAFEHELAISADPVRVLLLRNEAGRLALLVGDAERAKLHFESTLLRDPNSLVALRGLRAVARMMEDWRDAASYCEAELGLVSGQERLGVAMVRVHYLLMARELDVARVAVGELVESNPDELPLRMLELELAFIDDRMEEVVAICAYVTQRWGGQETGLAVAPADRSFVRWAERVVAAAEMNASPAQAVRRLAAHESDSAAPGIGAEVLRLEALALAGAHEALARELSELATRVAPVDGAMAAALAAHAGDIAMRQLTEAARVAYEQQAFELASSSTFVAERMTASWGHDGVDTAATHALATLAAVDDPRHRAYVRHVATRQTGESLANVASALLADTLAALAHHRLASQDPADAALAFWDASPQVVGAQDPDFETLAQLREGDLVPWWGEPRLHAAWLGAIAGQGGEAIAALHRELWEGIPLDDDSAPTVWLLRARALVWLERDGQHAVAQRQLLATHAPRLARMLEQPGRTAAVGRGPRAVATTMPQDAFAAALRGAEDAVARGESALAFGLLARAYSVRPVHPFAMATLAHAAGDSVNPSHVLPVVAEMRRHAESSSGAAAAAAFERLADLLMEACRDPAASLAAREAAIDTRHASATSWHSALAHYMAAQRATDSWGLRQGMLREPFVAQDAPALLLDTVALGERENKPDGELLPLYRQIAAGVDVARPGSARVLLLLESLARRQGSSRELADISVLISQVFAVEPLLSAAFLTRSAETLLDLGNYELAMAHFRNALATVPLYRAAASGWLRAAIAHQQWADAAEAARSEAVAVRDATAAGAAWHLAAVIEMDRKVPPDLQAAHALLRAAYAHDPYNRDVVVRLLWILGEQGDDDRRAAFWQEHLVHAKDPAVRVALHRELARYLDGQPHEESRQQALAQWEALRVVAPRDIEALRRLADIYWARRDYGACANILAARVRMEEDSETRSQLFRKLGELYTTGAPDPVLALRAWREVLVSAPNDVEVLEHIATAALAAGEAKVGLAACDRWLKTNPPPGSQAHCLRHMGQLFAALGEGKRAERALLAALDREPSDGQALAALVDTYRASGDMGAAKVRLDRLANVLRAACMDTPTPEGFLALARVHEARAGMGGEGVWVEAAFCHQMASYLQGVPAPVVGDGRVGLVAELLHLLFPVEMSAELRHIFGSTGDRLAKHIGTDLRAFGVSRADRLRGEDEAAARIMSAAARAGFPDVDLYATDALPLACVPILTQPLVLVVGRELLGRPSALRAAVMAALFLAQTRLALAMTLAPEPFSQLLASLVHLFQGIAVPGHDARQVEREAQKLRRLLPSAVLTELRPFGLALDPAVCSGTAFRDQVLVAAYRAGLLASGDLGAVIDVILGGRSIAPAAALAHPTVREVIRFAISDEAAQFGAAIGRATKSTIPPAGINVP